VQAAKMKYEETEYDVVQRMMYFQECEEDHLNALTEILDAQLSYHKASAEVLERAQKNWGQADQPRTQDSVRPALKTSLSRSFTTSGALRRNTAASARSDGDDSYGNGDGYQQRASSTFATVGSRPNGRQGSQDNLHSTIRPQSSYSSAGRSDDSYGAQGRLGPPPIPRAKPSSTKKKVKAIYDFSGDNPNELNLYGGDIISVIEEIDDGWWMGEMYDANGVKQQGLFPSNYVEEIAAPPMPTRPGSDRSWSTSHFSQASEPLEITEEPDEEASPFADSSQVSNSYSHASPPKPMMTRGGTAGSLHSSPNASPALSRMPSANQVSMRTNIGSSRTPPPPPTVRTPSRSSTTTGSHTAPPTPLGRSGNNYFNGPTSKPHQTHPPCADCGCDEFSADVFKPTRCKVCFHYHS